MTSLGLALTFLSLLPLLISFFRKRRHPFPLYGYIALAILLAAQVLLFRRVHLITIYFTPIAWTCWILLIAAAIRAVSGRSPLTLPHLFPDALPTARFPLLVSAALLSTPLWVIFEVYNLRLQNWVYVGPLENLFALGLGYVWSFATISPAMFLIADLALALGWFPPRRAPAASPATPPATSTATRAFRLDRALIAAGLILLLIPLLVPRESAGYLFALVWLGFILLLDPINHHFRLPSLFSYSTSVPSKTPSPAPPHRRSRVLALLYSGLLSGFLWEFWNFWAAAKWLYIFPMFQTWKIFEMPAPGYLGFPPFALESFAMFVTAAWLLKLLRPAVPTGARTNGRKSPAPLAHPSSN